eukprot:CAMPEP_0204545342 /NCGR_PEP_ID=MMETSP0661-20131031/21203_1 /ASSEMBLY_ACC=CAM_ASM_000606 /TAXON_ID=109239 /ORGANISM="Alexandrium margalefi, Strain AMGDE01CS-322" /LENGTH=40 /DNA_ID= /DNA_START= /DNA_END= /DNA_ORIENTATION=
MRILRMLARRGYSIDRMGVDMVAMAPAGAYRTRAAGLRTG